MSAAEPLASPVVAAIETLRERFGERLSTSEAVRRHHGTGEAYHPISPPDAVVWPRDIDEVVAVVRVAAEHRVPIIPYGAGTSLEGHTLALHGGIAIDLSQMNAILRVSAEDLDCTVQAGVTRKQLNAHLRDTGLFFPIDPGADATIGGMSATRASGTNAVRYGTMRENVLGLTVVLADGRVVRTGTRARKSAAGYDLTRLMVGSEGTLGIICEVTLRLSPQPEAVSAAVCAFPTLGDAVHTVIETIQSAIPVARMELVCSEGMSALIDHSGLEGYEVADTLFFEFHGTESGVAEQVEAVSAIAAEHGGSAFRFAARTEDRNALWQARHDAHYAFMARAKPGQRVMATDVCVPISRLAECVLESKRDLDASGLWSPVVGHVGDGNFHMGPLADYTNPEEHARAKAWHARMVERAIRLGGTCTGEHGIGCGKMEFLELEHGEGVEVMRTLKRALDPQGIMNPGKVVLV
ncbi:MAG: FAD-binding protein [Ectothiorhodospiraceae bacterium]|nr:FAD-binding protein [Ectothiorhodospiraceae bacterium]